jgi:hypothetical protein
LYNYIKIHGERYINSNGNIVIFISVIKIVTNRRVMYVPRTSLHL